MKKRCLAIWLAVCMIFLSMPTEGLIAVANTLVTAEKATAEKIVVEGFVYAVNSDGTTLTLDSVSDNTITSLAIPATVSANGTEYRVTGVKYRAFEGWEQLTSVELPDSLEQLGYHAFKNCVSLTSIEIPNTLTTISGLTSSSPFVGCENLKEIIFENGIRKIPAHMFQGFKTLEKIEIPDGVEEIGYQAFAYCTALKEVELPSGLKKLGEQAFIGCDSLENIELPDSVTEISIRVFEECDKLTDVVLPDSLEKLGSHAFKNCVSLKSMEIPNTLTEISGITLSASPFVGCDNLSKITFENGIEKIPSYICKSFKTLTKIIVPDGVEEIGAEAFYNAQALKDVTLPEGLKIIRGEVFSGCGSLSEIYIPSTVNTFGTKIFEGTDNVVIHTHKDTYASVYAMDNRIAFRWIGNAVKSGQEDMLDRNKCQYITDVSSSANGYISYQIDYGFKEAVQAVQLKLSVYIPDHVVLEQASILEDGILSTDYSVKGNVLTIPVSKNSGTIKYKVKQQDQNACYSYATVSYWLNKKSCTEVIGATEAKLLDLSLEMDEETDAEEFPVCGVALPGKDVKIYVDDVLNTQITASKAGVYQADVTIVSPKNYRTYNVKAVSADASGEDISVNKKITFIPGIPKLKNFVMEHNGQKYSLAELEGLKPIVTFRDHCEFTFEADFANDEQIESVYFVSTRNNIEKKMKATKMSGGTYKATGFFDPSNPNYVPGTITIEYIRAGKTSYFDGNIDFSAEKYVNSLPEEFAGAEAVNIVKTENEVSAVLTFPELDNSRIDFSVSEQDIPEGLTPENAEQFGFERIGGPQMVQSLASEGIAVNKAETPATLFFREIENEVTGQLEAQLLDFAEEKIKKVSGYGSMIELYKGYGSVMEWMETGVTYKENRLKIKDAKEAVLSGNWSAAEKEQALDHLETAQILNNKKVALQVAATILTVAGIANPTLSFMIGAMSFLTDYRLEASMLDVNSLVAKVSGSAQINFRWAIDPSGYVYDKDTLERLSGVTVTLYYKETESSTALLWDASEYLQLNPLSTAEDGTYAWDVPEGLWQVKAEKEGYETACSSWLPVPPPQTEVNIGLSKIDNGADDGGNTDDEAADPPQDPPASEIKPVKVAKITLGGISKKIAAGKKIRLTANVLPANADNKAIIWSSSNTKYATVNSYGMVSVKKAGSGKRVTITATAKDGSGVKARYTIKIMKHRVTKISLKASKTTVTAGKSLKVKAMVKTNGKKANKTVKWASSNTKYATVTKKGVVKTKKSGKGKMVTITATATDGTGKKAKIKIKIK